MAQVANVYTTSDGKLNREDLSDMISRITPSDTPIYSSIIKGRARAIKVEWGVDALDEVTDNAVPEGEEWSYSKPNTADRRSNYCQIFRKSFAITGSQQAVRSAGQDGKVAKETVKKGLEIRKDVEASILLGNPSIKDGTRKSGSLSTWLETNVSAHSGTTIGGFKEADGLTDAPSAGTKRAFMKDQLDDVMTDIYSNGGNPSRVFVSPYVRTLVSKFFSDQNTAQQRIAAPAQKGASVNAAVDYYLDPQGTLVAVMTDRVMTAGSAALNAKMARNAYVVDRRRAAWCWLRPINRQKDIPRSGDAQPVVILGEGCLKVHNEKAHGGIFDLNGLSASE